jgi:hypothetical protein
VVQDVSELVYGGYYTPDERIATNARVMLTGDYASMCSVRLSAAVSRKAKLVRSTNVEE